MMYYLNISNFPIIVAAVASIPDGTTSLDLRENSLHLMPQEKLIAMMAAIPESVTSLDLRGNHLNEMTQEKFIGMMDAIPQRVTSLNLSRNRLNAMTQENLIAMMGAMPQNVTSLDLSGNHFYLMPQAKLIGMMGAIPQNVTSLDLSRNFLNEMSQENLLNMMGAIHPGVISLDLSGNRLGVMSQAKLTAIMGAIPQNVTSLDLSENHLDWMPQAKLIAMMGAIPQSITSLDLSWNALHRMTQENLIAMMSAIPPGVTSLNLSWNRLNTMTQENLIAMMGAVPPAVTSLSLSDNCLNEMTQENLTAMMGAIPQNVTSINLSGNSFRQLSIQNLRITIESIPAHVTSINLNKNHLFDNKAHDEIDAFLKELGDVRFRMGLKFGHNGESELARAIVPLAQMSTSGIPILRYTKKDQLFKLCGIDVHKTRVGELTIPSEVSALIASFVLGPEEKNTGLAIEKPSKAVGARKERDAKEKEAYDAWVEGWAQFASDTLSMPSPQATSLALSAAMLLICSHVAMLTLGTGLMLLAASGMSKHAYDLMNALPGPEYFEKNVTLPLLRAMNVLPHVSPLSHIEEITSYLSDDGVEECKGEPKLTNKRNAFFLDEPGHGRCIGEDSMHDGQLFSSYNTLLY